MPCELIEEEVQEDEEDRLLSPLVSNFQSKRPTRQARDNKHKVDCWRKGSHCVSFQNSSRQTSISAFEEGVARQQEKDLSLCQSATKSRNKSSQLGSKGSKEQRLSQIRVSFSSSNRDTRKEYQPVRKSKGQMQQASLQGSGTGVTLPKYTKEALRKPKEEEKQGRKE